MRSEIVSEWLASSAWSSWRREQMTSDASARRYERLYGPSGDTVILMDAPPEMCGSQLRFVQMANHLRKINLAAPEVFLWEEGLGLIILEDLGTIDFATHLATSPHQERELYEAAVDALLTLQSIAPPEGLTIMTPAVGAEMISIAFDWAATDNSQGLRADIQNQMIGLLEQFELHPSVLSLRDFHAENLIWRPERTGSYRVGLLDFQDAFVTHPTYDLASLIRDARRDVDPDLLNHLLDRLVPSKAQKDAYLTAFHVFAVQRNLRILGIFERLAKQDGKQGYRALVPRVVDHLKTDLTAPTCRDIAPLIRRAFVELEP